jgi:hypothetical protein
MMMIMVVGRGTILLGRGWGQKKVPRVTRIKLHYVCV